MDKEKQSVQFGVNRESKGAVDFSQCFDALQKQDTEKLYESSCYKYVLDQSQCVLRLTKEEAAHA